MRIFGLIYFLIAVFTLAAFIGYGLAKRVQIQAKYRKHVAGLGMFVLKVLALLLSYAWLDGAVLNKAANAYEKGIDYMSFLQASTQELLIQSPVEEAAYPMRFNSIDTLPQDFSTVLDADTQFWAPAPQTEL